MLNRFLDRNIAHVELADIPDLASRSETPPFRRSGSVSRVSQQWVLRHRQHFESVLGVLVRQVSVVTTLELGKQLERMCRETVRGNERGCSSTLVLTKSWEKNAQRLKGRGFKHTSQY